MTDIKDQLARLLDTEPPAAFDIDTIVRSGRRGRRSRNLALAAAGTAGAAGLAAAGAIPLLSTGGRAPSVSLRVQPPPAPTPTAAKCYIVVAPAKQVKHQIGRLIQSGKVGRQPSVTKFKGVTKGKGGFVEVCSPGTLPRDLRQAKRGESQPPAGPPYHYTEQPEAISSRLGAHLQDHVSGYGLAVTYTRPFSQESSTLDHGHPSYFGGNVDVHETSGYGDIGVQVTHAVTDLVPFTGACNFSRHCTETKLPDGSILRTGQVRAGKTDMLLTAEVHRPDGVVVQAQESNYPFGPDAGSRPHGNQPLTLDQLTSLAEDEAFTF